jgi:acyl carrier protein
VQVSRGYLNREELTQERFVLDPYSGVTGGRMYRTGDLGRWLGDGNIEYMGRIDDQVKIRGYRIELGEIENVLMESGMLDQGVVLARADGHGQKRLVGYIVVKEHYRKSELVTWLKQKLPEYMIPGIWIELESIPLTSNGKIDRKGLPEGEIGLELGAYVEAQTVMEKAMTEIWVDLLQIPRAGIEDNFFELGGHSLLAMRMISSLRRELGIELGVRELFRYPTIRELS